MTTTKPITSTTSVARSTASRKRKGVVAQEYYENDFPWEEALERGKLYEAKLAAHLLEKTAVKTRTATSTVSLAAVEEAKRTKSSVALLPSDSGVMDGGWEMFHQRHIVHF